MQDKLKHINFLVRVIQASLTGLVMYNTTFANNTSYIALSNYVAKKKQMEVSANNTANINTVGFEADEVIFNNIELKQSTARSHSFVYANGVYFSQNKGPVKMTYRPLDMAIAGHGYFKILTPRGEKYTLNGAVFVNSRYELVNIDGLPFASRNNAPVIIPVDTLNVSISEDGTVFADGVEQEAFGIFSFVKPNALVKEGNNLYGSRVRDILLDDFTIISGALRGSNVNSAKSMTELIELQRSAGMTNNLMANVAELEKSLITKVAK